MVKYHRERRGIDRGLKGQLMSKCELRFWAVTNVSEMCALTV